MSYNYLVTGGAGFIGSNFVQMLAKKPDCKITVLDSMTYAADVRNIASVLDEGHRLIEGSISDPELIDRLVKQNDFIVNFAAASHNDNSVSDPSPFIETNIVGTYNVLEAVRNHGKRLHHISTDEVFGDTQLDSVAKFDENTRYNPSSPYSSSKASADHLVRAWSRTFNIKATISNCGNNFGKYQHVEKFLPRQITNLLIGQKPVLYGSGLNVRDWIHVEDHCEAIDQIIAKSQIGQTYLIGASNERTNLAVVRDLLDIFGKPHDFISFTHDRAGHDLRYAIDSSKITKELGWSPKRIDFVKNLEATVSWYAQNSELWMEKKGETETKYGQFIYGQ
jgi:dTDP-glucose 4,6-dehydratase